MRRVSGSELRFRNIDRIQLAATAAYNMKERRANVSALQLRAPWGALSGEGTVAVASGTSRVRADVTSVDASSLMRALDMPYVAASRVDAHVQAEWPGLDYLKATGGAHVTLTPSTARVERSVLPLGGRLDVTAREGRAVARLQSVSAAGADRQRTRDADRSATPRGCAADACCGCRSHRRRSPRPFWGVGVARYSRLRSPGPWP